MSGIPRIDGIPIAVNGYLCQRAFVGWNRTHRKKRIAKKWRKRYGRKMACQGHSFMVGHKLHCCPCAYAKLKVALQERIAQ